MVIAGVAAGGSSVCGLGFSVRYACTSGSSERNKMLASSSFHGATRRRAGPIAGAAFDPALIRAVIDRGGLRTRSGAARARPISPGLHTAPAKSALGSAPQAA